MTRATISEILVLKVGCLKILEKKFVIKIGNRNLFIQNQRVREIISDRKEDILYIYTIKNKNDFIFTSDLNLNAKRLLRRESLTRSVNKALKFVGKNLKPVRKLTSNSFRK